jgi:hypothetical protein
VSDAPLDSADAAEAGDAGVDAHDAATNPCTGVVCTASDACHVAGTCNPMTGACSNPAASDGTSCVGTDLCFQTSTCQGGVCTGSNPVVCTASDQCHAAGTCDAMTGTCSNPAATNGTACTGSNLCLQTNTCQSGVCTGSNPVVCAPLDQCHVAGTCNPATGGCTNPDATDGTACTSSVACTLSATCQAGVCSGAACPTGLCGSSLVAFNGTKTAHWSFNGNASYDSAANTAVLADGLSNGEAGTVVYQDPIAADAFTVTFDFKMTSTNGRADGIVFMMQTNGNTAVGAGYGGFGALGLTGYGVELDIFDSGPCDPGNGNHASVDLFSPCATNGGIPSPVATSNDLFDSSQPGNGVGDIADGTWRTATIQLAGGQLSVSITGTSGNFAVSNLQGVSLPGFVSGTQYYLGFGAGTGSNGLAARQEIRNVDVSFGAMRCL